MQTKATSHSTSHDLNNFLESGDLAHLHDHPLVGEKDKRFKRLKEYECWLISLSSVCLNWCFVPSLCYYSSMLDRAGMSLTDEAVEFSQPVPSCCVLGETKRTIRFENITDVTVEDACLMRCAGVKQLIVQTAGTGGVVLGTNLPGIQAAFLKEPELWKAVINHACKLQRESPPESMTMSSSGPAHAARMMEVRQHRLQELIKRGILTPEQGASSMLGLLMQNQDYTVKLLGLHKLLLNGQLKKQEFHTAVSQVLSVWSSPLVCYAVM